VNITRLPIRSVAALGAATLLTLAGCGGDDDNSEADPAPAATAAPAQEEQPAAEPAGASTITIADFAFGGITEIAAATTVTITNDDSAPHTLTADDGSFDAGTIGAGESIEFTFPEAGEFTYHCNFHPSMTGKIVVAG
jgi:plastocyanin